MAVAVVGGVGASLVETEVVPDVRATLAGTVTEVRYGENPHQVGAFVGDLDRVVRVVATNASKPLPSYNNWLDLDAGIALMVDFLHEGPTTAVLKHGIPCALASADSLAEAWSRAIEVDTISPFGGVAVFNMALDGETARLVARLYLDVVAAPDFEPGVVQLLRNKTVVRINTWDVRRVAVRSALGGLLVHERDIDPCTAECTHASPRKWQVATVRAPDAAQTEDLLYAERACKHVKSNAVVLVKDRRLIAVGAAQPCRVGAVEVAFLRARTYPRPPLDLGGSVMASDAYFPFPDAVEVAAAGGVVSIVQPGGSRNDRASIEACDAAGVSMVLTGVRHFRH